MAKRAGREVGGGRTAGRRSDASRQRVDEAGRSSAGRPSRLRDRGEGASASAPRRGDAAPRSRSWKRTRTGHCRRGGSPILASCGSVPRSSLGGHGCGRGRLHGGVDEEARVIGWVLVVGVGCAMGAEPRAGGVEPGAPPRPAGDKAPPPAAPSSAAGGKASPRADAAKTASGSRRHRGPASSRSAARRRRGPGSKLKAGGLLSLPADGARPLDEEAASPADPTRPLVNDAAPPAEPAKAGGGGCRRRASRSRRERRHRRLASSCPRSSSGGALPRRPRWPCMGRGRPPLEQRRQAARMFEEANAELEARLPDKAVEKYRAALKLVAAPGDSLQPGDWR